MQRILVDYMLRSSYFSTASELADSNHIQVWLPLHSISELITYLGHSELPPSSQLSSILLTNMEFYSFEIFEVCPSRLSLGVVDVVVSLC